MSSTSSTTSPDDAGSNSTETTGEDTTKPFPTAGDTQPLAPPVTQPLAEPAVEPETQPVTMPLPASEEAGAEAASADSAPASSTPGPVWSAGTITEQDRPQAPQDIKGSTLLWGAFLLLVGGLLIAAGLGLRFDFTTTAIACLAGLGGLLVIAALIPKGLRSSKKP
ncbi:MULTISPECIES: hypothetical protein [Actinomyces]|uniref:Uncharacterized protein n=1 Tax=Actinomyces oris TaxID=544580 RepID=A0A1Q8VVJ3_9ACTO|nr:MULTISPECIES: hypothetical protein [Actinomyces]OFR49701.1 hypothetical protein HMPREF2883_08780 [Actinomyces sp. HMSC075C01]OLO52030.1 hypothetical protein BKH26_13520 [Actinomyces oris]OLO52160.1 hypothetical protein BKH27_10090 [Actinomyces oris]OLO58591.1 hypothetical protein BKH24_10600 [Actinomyces oris]